MLCSDFWTQGREPSIVVLQLEMVPKRALENNTEKMLNDFSGTHVDASQIKSQLQRLHSDGLNVA